MTSDDDMCQMVASDVDYPMLEEALGNSRWPVADWYTRLLMCYISGREECPNLIPEVVETFPCADLDRIDHLWLDASDGMYGFSVQRCFQSDTSGKARGLMDAALGPLKAVIVSTPPEDGTR